MKNITSLFFFPGYPYPYNQPPYPMAHPGGQSVAPYPVSPEGYGDHVQAPPPGFNMNYNQGPPPVMYQPGPVAPGPEYGGPHGGISPAPMGVAATAAVGVPPGLEYLTQVGRRQSKKKKSCDSSLL